MTRLKCPVCETWWIAEIRLCPHIVYGKKGMFHEYFNEDNL